MADAAAISIPPRRTGVGVLPKAAAGLTLVNANGTSAEANGVSVETNETSVGANGVPVDANETSVGADGVSVDADGTFVGADRTSVDADGRLTWRITAQKRGFVFSDLPRVGRSRHRRTSGRDLR